MVSVGIQITDFEYSRILPHKGNSKDNKRQSRFRFIAEGIVNVRIHFLIIEFRL
ncbi:hypothetical protein LEP1GSC085_2352 [Leptospira interrogans str. L0996]|nr:hypothetical protein LEP1GSC085_2352 [Leptospira interrogans str. L0996]